MKFYITMNSTVGNEVNLTGNNSFIKVIWTDLQFYPLITFMYACLVVSLLGNVAVMVALWSKNVESLSGKFVKVITIIDIGLALAFFVPICVTMTAGLKHWIMVRSWCLLQGILETSLLFGHSLCTLYLTIEKFYTFKKKEEMKWMSQHFDKIVAMTMLSAVIVCTSLLIESEKNYVFLRISQRCVLTVYRFGGFLRILFYIAPNFIIVLLWALIVNGKCCKTNRISDAGDVPQTNYRRGTIRNSLFPKSDHANSLATFAESRRTIKLSIVQIALSLLHISSGILFFLCFILDVNKSLMSMGSMVTFAASVMARPVLLFMINAPLRAAFKQALTIKRRPKSSLSSVYRSSGLSVLPREDSIEDMPDFLKRNASGMLIRVQVSSTPDSASQNQDKHDFQVALPLRTLDKGYNSMPTTPDRRGLKLQTVAMRKSTSESSSELESISAKAETRSSHSSLSLNVSDLCRYQ